MRLPLSLFLATCMTAVASCHSLAREAAQPMSNAPSSLGVDAAATILSRIGPPSDKVLAVFVESGMKVPTNHPLTKAETAQLVTAIAHLPPIYQSALLQHLHRLSFVDGIPGEGTGLTGSFDNPAHQYDVTFRASVFNETLSQFFATKESRCFHPDGSGTRLSVDAGGLVAFDYVFLHEATHVLSLSSGWPDHDPFNDDIWLSYQTLAAPYDKEPIAQTYFRSGKKYPAAYSVNVYRALARTPFVDLFAAVSEEEDLASLLAFYLIRSEYGVSPIIEVRDGAGSLLFQYEPLNSPDVKSRFVAIDSVLKPKR